MNHILASTVARYTEAKDQTFEGSYSTSGCAFTAPSPVTDPLTVEKTCSSVADLLPSHKPRSQRALMDFRRDSVQDALTELEIDSRIISL